MSTTTQPLPYLELSTGPLDPEEIAAVNMNTYHIAGHCNAVAVWRKDSLTPCYFPHGSADAVMIASWVNAQSEERFLRMRSCLFAISCIESASIDDASASIQLFGYPLRFVFSDVTARLALLLWAGEDTAPLPAIA